MPNQVVLGQLPLLPWSVPPRIHSSSLQPAPRARLLQVRHVEETVLGCLAAAALAKLQIYAARGEELLARPLLRQELDQALRLLHA